MDLFDFCVFPGSLFLVRLGTLPMDQHKFPSFSFFLEICLTRSLPHSLLFDLVN